MSDPFDNTENTKIEERRKRYRDREIGDIRKILALPEGRRFMWRIMEFAGPTRLSFSQNDRTTAFNEGRREVGLFLLKDIMEVKPEAFIQMQREHISEAKADAQKGDEDSES
jgi:hypothetical protein